MAITAKPSLAICGHTTGIIEFSAAAAETTHWVVLPFEVELDGLLLACQQTCPWPSMATRRIAELSVLPAPGCPTGEVPVEPNFGCGDCLYPLHRCSPVCPQPRPRGTACNKNR
jgi:hypothetical protein